MAAHTDVTTTESSRYLNQYMFIDGAYLTELLKNFSNEFFNGNEVILDYQAFSGSAPAGKVFYYDSLPAHIHGEVDTDYQLRSKPQSDLFDRLRKLRGWHVSEGRAKHRRRYGSTQKEVDILIAVDMLTHTHRRNMESLVFVAGDQDFRPLLEALIREGMYANLWYE